MIRIPLPSDDTYLLLLPRFGDLTPGWQGIFLGALLLVPLGLIVWLYRYELKLISRAAACCLLLLRVVVLLLLWGVIGLQPTVARYQETEVPSRVLVAIDFSGSMGVQDVQRQQQEKEDLAKALKIEAGASIGEKIDALPRSEIVRRILTPQGLDWIERLSRNHTVQVVGFNKVLWDIPANGLEGAFVAKAKPDDKSLATDLRLPLSRALEPTGGEHGKLLGVVVFTDGQHNAANIPLARAKELGEVRVPIYPVLIGAKDPPADIAVLDVVGPANVYKDTDVALESRLRITGVPAGKIQVELTLNGKPTGQKKTIAHDGQNRVVPVRFKLAMNEIGSHTLQVTARAESKDLPEISTDNNVQSAVVRVAQEKARVLLVDGEMRWEYHYLANAFLRDPTMQVDQVVFSQPRIGNLPEDKLTGLGHPAVTLPALKPGKEDPLNGYDCIFLGDVPPERLALEDRRRLEQYVDQRGGTLVLVAGKRSLPMEYLAGAKADQDPLMKLLPITEPRIHQPAEGFQIALTSEGRHASFLQLESEPQANAERFAGFPKHFWGVIGKAKPGATILAMPAELPAAQDKEPRGLLVQHNYGFGRVLLVGIDSTWRWRYRVGDTHHHRFWSQIVRWSATDKLLPGGNRFVRFGSRQGVVRHDQPAQIAVRLAEAATSLKPDAVKQVRLWRQTADGKEEQAAVLPLVQNQKQGKLLEAEARDLPGGQYRIEVDIPDLRKELAEPPEPEEKNIPRRDWFTVLPPEEGELFDLATNESLLRGLAEESKGRLFTPENVEVLLDVFARQLTKKEEREEQRLWQDAFLVWGTLGIILVLLSAEWIGRKLAGLP